MIEMPKLYTTLSYADEQGLFNDLEKIYKKLPDTYCNKCSTCCTVPPPGYLIEFLNLFKYVRNNLKEHHNQILKDVVRYFFLELADINIKCPFLGEDNNCVVYSVRPLGCRMYGLLSEKDFKLGAKRELKDIAQKYRDNYNIELPEEILNFELPFCDQVQRFDGKNGDKKYVSIELIQSMATDIEKLESEIMPPQVLEEHYTFVPMATHMALSILTKGARMRRPRVIKEYLENDYSPMLEEYVERFSRQVL